MTSSGRPANVQATANAQVGLAAASAQAVADAFANLKRYLPRDRWLGSQNAYRTGTVEAIRDDCSNGNLNQKHLAEYIAASAPLHASDGWAFLGRAMQAHLLGDRSAARHLAYYAELRAAMAILAAHGIGIFDKQHFAVTSATGVTKINGAPGTHVFAWQALQWWASRSGSWNLVGDAVRPYGRNLNDWLAAVPKYASWGPVASSWIESLGLDIQRVASDQFSRNDASYRPTRIVEPQTLDVRSGAEFAINLWRALEPGPNGFPNLDLHVLRVTLERAFEAVESSKPARQPTAFATAAVAVSGAAAQPEPTRLRLERFLRRQTEPADLEMLHEAAANSSSSDPRHHMQVMSRAATLLVLATAAARRLTERSGLDLGDTAFWWEALGAERGMWRTAPPTSDLRDLWQDVRMELEVLEDWLAAPGIRTCAEFVTGCPTVFIRLSQFEFAALWGMAA